MVKMGRKQCAKKGCRKLRFEDYNYCKDHKPFDPVEDVVRLTVAEAEKWGRLDAEIRNLLLSQRCKVLENKLDIISCRENLQILEKSYKEQLAKLAANYKQQKEQFEVTLRDSRVCRSNEQEVLKQQIDRQKISYQAFNIEVAKKYSVDATKMVIDPDTRSIREAE